MIETLQWISQLAERSELQYESCEELWSLLGRIVSDRLASAIPVSVAGVVAWHVRKEMEYVALLPSGSRLLVPPRLHLETSLASSAAPDDLEEILQESSPLSPKSVHAFYQALTEQMLHHLHSGNAFLWEGIGLFEGVAQEELAFTFTPSERLLQSINKPFDAFSPIALPQDKAFDDLPQRAIDQEEDLTKIPVYSVCQAFPAEEIEESAPSPNLLEVEEIASKEESGEPLLPTDELLPQQEEEEACCASEMPAPPIPRHPHSRRKLWLWVSLPLLCPLLVGGYFVGARFLSRSSSKPSREKTAAAPHRTDSTPTDSVVVAPVPEVIEEVYITIKKGDRLADYAREHYGNKKFWIYIYLANEAKISNPDNVPIGTTLRVPRPEEYNIDAQDPEALARADSLITVVRSRR
ncbi:LysM peptidoglycan-binding domain-containing protein [Porphyromonas endodontalis]